MNEINQSPFYTHTPDVDWDQIKEQVADVSTTPEYKAAAMPPAEQEHHLFVRKSSPRYGHTYVGAEYDFIYWLLRAEKLVDRIVRGDDQTVEVTHDRKGQARYQLTRIGKAVFNVCKSYNEDSAEYYKHHRFNPPLTVILKVIDQWSRELWAHTNRNGDPMPSDPRTREIIESTVASIRTACRTQEYKNEVDNYKRNEEKNIISCCEYLAAQFQRRAQLLILRIDLYFRPPFKGWGYTREADRHYAKLLRALRENRIVPDVLGYISKREDGIDRGIHFHALIVLDGHKHRDAANLTRMVGEDWVHRCGHGDYEDGVDVGETGKKDKASYFNCYTRMDQYRFNGLGLIHPTDADKLRGLRLAIEYMCKETTQLKPSPPKSHDSDQDAGTASRKGIRNLRKGIMPKGHSGRGAPRSSGLDTSAIDRELLKN
ncbi:hypothetical protein DSC_11790 [Pseudoxanthomonas spadix BD-a59]|uniref:Inovirus Gp2 family protein n=1 Tax=Pseudoxanthomonas spadix (strain BD-a59) TaxID=1045855 RepID=G7UQJ9_PSEUP|nr:inovirus-type Gp2 protein [Pseudoxanthomonas spadix]AER57002.1 hypothetical protein DSC_11790 [Pseudoxanthomonas spadix BD-a59]